jgi:hypothetical protein
VYSIFLGSETSSVGSQIMFAKSSDCGNTWGKPIKLSETVHVCQGTNVVVSPLDGTIYVVWRQYAREQQGVPDAIVMSTSTNSGRSFTKAKVFHEINPYDQFTASNRFRTSAFPAIAVDHNGLVYVAWSQLGVEGAPADVPRIVIKTMNGKKFSDPEPIDNHSGRGHQIMPSLTYAGGVLTATWYDTRNSPLNMFPEISGEDQTMDVRAAQANPSNSIGTPANPVFSNSVRVSRYFYYAKTNEDGILVGENGYPVDENNPPVIIQANSDRPNLPIFDGGGSPFMGDYLDSAPSPMFLRDYGTGEWRFNTGEGPFDPTLCHIVFACNRDVVPPRKDLGLNWLSYQPPGTPGCLDDLTTGMRDQNVYTAPLTQGIQAYCPVNTKPLSLERSSFLVFVRNLTDYPKDIRLTIDAPSDMNASFWEFGPPAEPGEECPLPFSSCTDRVVELPVLAHSSITLTVFVWEYHTSDATLRVNVEEILTGLKSAIILNPDPVNTNLIDPAQVLEYDAPFLITEDLSPWDFDDVTVFSEEIVFTPEVLVELLESCNPDILAPTRRHPTRRHDAILNPTRRHSAIGVSHDGQVTDISWSVENTGTATSAYSFDLLGETPSVPYQLLIYRVSSTPMSEGCDLSAEEHHELLLSFEDPSPLSPTRRHEDLRNPTRRHNTFYLAPGETAICTLRLIDPQNPHPFDPEFYANTVTGAFIPQAANEIGVIEAAAFMWIYTTALPDGTVNAPYVPEPYLEAEGGTGSYTWSLVEGYDNLPPGLTLYSDGRIWGTPTSDSPYDENNEKTYNFAVQATDGEQTAYRSLSIKIISPNTAPVAYDQDVGTNEDTFVEITLTASDAEEDPLTYSVVSGSGPTNGTLSGTPPDLTYTPYADYYGLDSFKFIANDGQADSNEATVTITVNPVNDAPSFSPGSNVAVNEDSGNYLQLWASDMSPGPANESGQTLEFNVDNDNNDLFAFQPSIDATSGDLNFRPADNMFGQATVTVTLSDDGGTVNGGDDTSDAATFVLTVYPVPDAPVAVDDNYTLIKGPPRKGRQDYVLEVNAEDGVLANDTDADGDSLTAIMVTKPIRGGMTFRSDGSFRYRLNDEFVGTVIFTYQVSDGNGGTDTATVTIIVEN